MDTVPSVQIETRIWKIKLLLTDPMVYCNQSHQIRVSKSMHGVLFSPECNSEPPILEYSGILNYAQLLQILLG